MLREELTLMVNAKTVNIQNTTYTLKGLAIPTIYLIQQYENIIKKGTEG